MNAATGSAVLILSRAKGGRRDLFRAYKVLVDDDEVGTIKRGQRLELPVAAGRHVLRLTIDWCSSRPLQLELSAGESVEVTCAPAGPEFSDENYIELKRA
jgi:hypothetical protein